MTSNYPARSSLTLNCGCQGEGFADQAAGAPDGIMDFIVNQRRQQLATNARRFSGADALSRLIDGEQPNDDDSNPWRKQLRGKSENFGKTIDGSFQPDRGARADLGFAERTGVTGMPLGGVSDRQAMGSVLPYAFSDANDQGGNDSARRAAEQGRQANRVYDEFGDEPQGLLDGYQRARRTAATFARRSRYV